MPKIQAGKLDASVVLCVYMAEKRIAPVIDSLLGQDYPRRRWELIIVDDASTDGTAETLKKQIAGHANARLLVHKVNKGLGGARNTGIAKAGGEFIFFTDDDCIIPPHWLSRGVKHFREEQENVGAIAGDVHIPHDTYIADCISYMGFPAGGNLGFRRMFDVDQENFTTSFTTANAIVRKSVLDGLEGPFDESLRKIQDKDVALRIQQRGCRIRYRDDLTVEHMAMPSLRAYLKRMYLKGGYGRHIAEKHHRQQRVYAGLRVRSILNVLRFSPKRLLPGIVPLVSIGYGMAVWGYLCDGLKTRGRK